jgi:hypothetical protein
MQPSYQKKIESKENRFLRCKSDFQCAVFLAQQAALSCRRQTKYKEKEARYHTAIRAMNGIENHATFRYHLPCDACHFMA